MSNFFGIDFGTTRGWTPGRIASELFRYLADCNSRVSQYPLNQAVVAIPIGMNPAKRAVLRQAAKSAGIEILSFVSEPTAACIANLEAIKHCRYIAVFDWGGGTLDISILELQGACLKELAHVPWDVAGDKIDLMFAEWMHQRVTEKSNLKLPFSEISNSARQRLINTAEMCKRELQVKPEAQVQLGNYEGRLERLAIKAADFDALINPIVKEAVDRLFLSVEKAAISEEAIGCLLLVGGSSKLRALEREIKMRWPPNDLVPDDAEWAIAKGAAILAANPGDFRLAEDVGLRLADGSFYTIFPIATKLDQARSILALGLVEDSRTASFIFETRKRDAIQSQSIGELHAEAFGFRDEVIALHSRINEDLILEAEAGSQSKPRAHRTFNYEELRWMYELPGIQR